MKNYNELADFIIQNVGGKENIEDLRHCMTRLRFKLLDESLADQEKLKSREDIIGLSHGGGRLQIIIGNAVEDVFREIISKIGGSKTLQEDNSEKINLTTRFIDTITKIITPILGALIAVGLMKGLLALLGAAGIIQNGDGAYIIINAIGDSLFYFFPVILGYTSAETFGLNKFMGMLLGCILIYPNILEALNGGEVIFSVFSGTPFTLEAHSSFLGIPILFPAMGYSSTVIPIIIITYFAAKVEKFFKKHIPDIVGFAIIPFLVLFICGSLGILLIGPITNILSNIISWSTISLYEFSPIIAAIVIAMLYQPLVIFGLHWPLITLAMQNVGTLGYDYLWPMMYAASFAQTAVVMAVGLKTKNKKLKAASVPAIISGFMCIIEPAIYGFTLPEKKRFFISCVSATIGGLIITLTNSTIVGLANGILGFPVFIKPDGNMSGMFIAIGACVITMFLAFTATWFTYKEVNPDNSKKAQIFSPVNGKSIPLKDIEDATFQSEVLGKTFVIYPETGEVFSPCDGIISSIFPTGHALGIQGNDGEEILIHIGIDTVQMEGKGFTKKVKEGESVKKGDLLIEFDIEEIKRSGFSPDVFVVITNSDQYDELEITAKNEITTSDILICAV